MTGAKSVHQLNARELDPHARFSAYAYTEGTSAPGMDWVRVGFFLTAKPQLAY